MNISTPAVFTANYWNIPQLDQTQLPAIQRHVDTKTKPIGALGQLETTGAAVMLNSRLSQRQLPTH